MILLPVVPSTIRGPNEPLLPESKAKLDNGRLDGTIAKTASKRTRCFVFMRLVGLVILDFNGDLRLGDEAVRIVEAKNIYRRRSHEVRSAGITTADI